MSNEPKPTGSISWVDLTITDAEKIRDFYEEVVGWKHDDVSMGDYADYCMIPSEGEGPVAGICHARGTNIDLPAQWLIYITVPDADAAASKCTAMGGRVIVGPKQMGPAGRYCVIQDPSGAVAALFSTKQS